MKPLGAKLFPLPRETELGYVATALVAPWQLPTHKYHDIFAKLVCPLKSGPP